VVQSCPLIFFFFFLCGYEREGEADERERERERERFTVAGREEIYFSSMTAHIFLYVLPRLWSKFFYFGLIKIW